MTTLQHNAGIPDTEHARRAGGSNKPSTYASLDAWRGLACLAVVSFHASAPFVGEHPALRSVPLYRITIHGGLGIHLFFVISGYCIATAAASILRRGESVGRYALARVRRIYPPYWFAFALTLCSYFAVVWLARHGHASSTSHTVADTAGALYPSSIISNVVLAHVPFHHESILGVSWTLSYELTFYAIVGVSLWAAKRRGGERLMLDGLHLLTIACLASLLFAPRLVVFPFDFWPEFGCGVLVYDLLRRAPSRRTHIFAAVVLALLIALPVNVSSGRRFGYGGDGGLDSCIVTLLFALTILFLHRHDGALLRFAPVRLLSYIGTFSYSLYLVHLVVLATFMWGFKRLGMDARLHYLCVALSIPGAVVAAYIFYHFCERPYLSNRRRVASDIEERQVIQAVSPA